MDLQRFRRLPLRHKLWCQENSTSDETRNNLYYDRYQYEKMATGGTIENLKGKNILVVDDSEENQILLRFYLTKAGVEVQSAANGAIGVEKALNNNFDLILMDIQMPIMDGYTATRTLRAAGYSKPIIALTANAMKEDRERSIASGCHDYLTKPITLSRLLTALARHIDKSSHDD